MPSDEELIQRVAQGDQEAVQQLHARYAPLLFHIVAQSLDAHAAEDLVQDVFLQLWRRAETFDPQKGRFKPWLLQITHYRILNELRRRSRQPALRPGSGEELLDEWPDPSPEPSEAVWKEFRRNAVRSAVDRLPNRQKQALTLAFFEDLSHDQVAQTLRLPLGTVKSQIRTALLKLRTALAPLGVFFLLAGAGLGFLLRSQDLLPWNDRSQRALELVSSSDTKEIHLSPVSGVNPATHGWYRSRGGVPTAVMALHKFPVPSRASVYQGWVQIQGKWISLGTARPDADGNAVLTVEGEAFKYSPRALEVTLEPSGGSAEPRGNIMISWSSP